MTRNHRRFVLALMLLAGFGVGGFGVGCATTAAPDARSGASRGSRDRSGLPAPLDLVAPGNEERALLLLLVDRQLYEPFSIGRLVSHPLPELRRQLALALARVPDPRALPVLEELATDSDATVRRAAAFAAGRIFVKESLTILEAILLDADDEVGAWAVHGLARAGVPLDRVAARLGTLPRASRQARLLPDLHLFGGKDAGRATYDAIALEGVTAEDAWLRRRALLALVSAARPAQRPAFERLLGDGDAAVRALAAGGLGRVGAADDLEALRIASGDADSAVAIAALGAGAAIVRGGRAAPPSGWRATLLERLADPRAPVRAVAIEAAASWLLDPQLEAALAVAVASGAPGERGRAVVALASGRAAAAGDLAVAAARDPEAWVRAAAAHAAGSLEATTLLGQLAVDSSSLVRAAALAARTRRDGRTSGELALHALGDPAPAVRATALDRLARSPSAPFEAILVAFARDERQAPELALSGVDALRARAEAAATERGSIVAALEGLTEVATFPVRIAAADALEALGRPRPALGTATTARTPRDYRSMTAQSRRARFVRIETGGAGAAVVRLDCADAPLQAISFLQLAEQGFYDGTMVYRAEPGARVEAGDPEGSGRGGPGFTVRDEPGPRRLRRGSFGLVRPAPHAAGSRFFVELGEGGPGEGDVTRLGEVVSGLDVLATLLEGDRIVRVREVPPPAELHSGPSGGRAIDQ